MSDTVTESSSPPETTEPVADVLRITGEQTIRTAAELHKALAEHLDRGLAVVMDLFEVEVCDAAGLQLLYALQRSALQRQQPFHITAVSQAITETIAELGLPNDSLMTPSWGTSSPEVTRADDGI